MAKTQSWYANRNKWKFITVTELISHNITIAGTEQEVAITVVNIRENAILRLPTLHQLSAVLDIANQQLRTLNGVTHSVQSIASLMFVSK